MPESTTAPTQTPPPSNLRPMRPVQRTPFDEQVLPVQTEAAAQSQPVKPNAGRDSCAFKCAMKFLGPWEGGYVDDPNDSGGATMRGVTHTEYDKYRTEKGLATQDVQKMSDEEHDDIYFNKYWKPSNADALPPKLAIAHFDWAVNHGVGGATKTLQESVGLTGNAVDGDWGKGTQKSLCAKLGEKSGADTLLGTYLDNRADWYKNRAQENPSQQKFLQGWLSRVDSPPDNNGRQGLRTYLNDMDNQCPDCAEKKPADDGKTGDPAIDALNLEPDVAQKALTLKQRAPGVMFNSGRRSAADQARAMAGNLVSDRDWMAKTYKASDTKDALQQWLNDNPKAVTRAAISDGLNSVFESLPADQVAKFSRHMSGRAFDIQPDSAPEKVVNELCPANFFTSEGGKKIWHVDF